MIITIHHHCSFFQLGTLTGTVAETGMIKEDLEHSRIESSAQQRNWAASPKHRGLNVEDPSHVGIRRHFVEDLKLASDMKSVESSVRCC